MIQVRMRTQFAPLLAACGLFSISAPVSAAGWADDWMDQSVVYGSSHYATDQRGYYGAGSISMRNRMTTDYVVSASPPRLEVGCGGIDLFGGGFSYLDPEYLVEKMERIIQAAPAFAFEIAMGEFCGPCKNAMEVLTSLTDQLNSIQINDCRMAKRLAVAVSEDKNVMKELAAEAMGKYSLDEGLEKNQQDVAQSVEAAGGASPNDTQLLLNDCPDVFRQVFGGGSVLRNAAALIGMEGYADVMRGLIGDAVVSYNTSARLYEVTKYEYCAANRDVDAVDFVDGTTQHRRLDDTCEPAGMTSVRQLLIDRMDGIKVKVVPGSIATLTAEEIAFVSRSPFPMLSLIGDASARGTVDEEIAALADPLADLYAQRMLEDLHDAMRYVFSKANAVSDKAGSVRDGGNYKRCDTTVVQPAIDHFRMQYDRITKLRADAAVTFARKQQEYIANRQVAQDLLQQRRRQLNRSIAADR